MIKKILNKILTFLVHTFGAIAVVCFTAGGIYLMYSLLFHTGAEDNAINIIFSGIISLLLCGLNVVVIDLIDD